MYSHGLPRNGGIYDFLIRRISYVMEGKKCNILCFLIKMRIIFTVKVSIYGKKQAPHAPGACNQLQRNSMPAANIIGFSSKLPDT